jgi:hypothetical protein|nr:MAG TPA: hypothetical protein [Caudoviricetes sp.]
MHTIYYFENIGEKNVVSADGLDFTKNVTDALNYIINQKKVDFNIIFFEKTNIRHSKIREKLNDADMKKFIETDKFFKFDNGVTMYRILKNDNLKEVQTVFFHLTTPQELEKICNKNPNKIFIWAPYTLKELEEIKNDSNYKLVKLDSYQ